MESLKQGSSLRRHTLWMVALLAAVLLSACSVSEDAPVGNNTVGTNEGSMVSPVNLDTVGVPHAGHVANTGGSYYTFTVPSTGTWKIEITGLSADADLYVLTNPSYSASAVCNPSNLFNSGTTPEDCTVNAAGGSILYIKLDGFGTSATYTLNVTAVALGGLVDEGSVASPVDLNTFGIPYSGQVLDSTSSFYTYTVASAGIWKVAMTGLSDDADLYVYTDTGFTAAATCSPDTTGAAGTTAEDCTVTTAGADTLYIKVDGFFTAAGATYTLNVTALAVGGLVNEGSVASPVSLNTAGVPYSGQVLDSTSSFYTYTVAAAGTWKVAMTGLSDDADLSVYTDTGFTAAATCSPDTTGAAGTTAEDCTVTTAGADTLYIKVNGFFTTAGSLHTLNVAAPVALTTVYLETYSNASTAQTGNDTLLYLYAGDGTTQLGFNDDGATAPGLYSQVTADLAPGTYYARVVGFNGSASRYTLLANTTGYTGGPSAGSPVDATNEPNNTAGTATALTLGVESDNTTTSADEDWFVFTLP